MKNIKNITVAIILTSLCAVSLQAATTKPFIVRNDKKKLMVKELSADENGVITYKTSNFAQKLKPGKYLFARTPMPKSVKNAAREYRAKKYKNAVKAFDTAFKTARYVGWGSFCMYYAAKSLENLNKKSEAIDHLKLLKKIPMDPDEMPFFLKAKKLEADILIAEKKFDDASAVLSIISRGGDQKTAMFANNAKGDILMAQGNKSEALYMYLRNVILFTPGKSQEAAKARTKAVEILEEQKNPRASEFAEMK